MIRWMRQVDADLPNAGLFVFGLLMFLVYCIVNLVARKTFTLDTFAIYMAWMIALKALTKDWSTK